MKDLFTALSTYNQKTNAIIFEYIKNMSLNQLNNPNETYYKAILEKIFHIMNSDMKWLSRMSSFSETKVTPEIIEPFTTDSKADVQLILNNRDSFIQLRISLDEKIKNLVASIPATSFTADFTMDFGPKKITKILWILLLQWFNHHTHHRGQISNLLSIAGIKNDFSLLLDKIE